MDKITFIGQLRPGPPILVHYFDAFGNSDWTFQVWILPAQGPFYS